MKLLQEYKNLCELNNFSSNEEQVKIIHAFHNFEIKHKNSNQKIRTTTRIRDLIYKFLNRSTIITHNKKIGLYIYGSVGRGKTMLMDLYFKNSQIVPKKRIHFHVFMKDIHKMLKEYRQKNISDPLQEIAKKIASETSLLCFDEFQVLDITDAMILKRLFDALIAHNLVFVITSNRPPDHLYENGLNRQLFISFIDDLKLKMEILTLDHNIDYRFEKIQEQQHYLYPLNVETKNKLTEIWNSLTDHAVGEIAKFNFNNREITLDKYFKTFLWTSFSSLCEQTLGVPDYMEIAKKFKYILIDSIPKLSSEKRNEATRFRNLIDVLYENKNIVYFRSDVLASILYKGNKYQFEFEFEFQRTVSRIQEMQSKEYNLQ